MSFGAYLDARRKEVEGALESFLPKPPAIPPVIADAMRYSLLGGGKRLRPLLVLASAEGVAQAIGASEAAARDLAMPAACAIEMIHSYSLIHDDLPSMDDDDLRRGKATCHKQFGEATAILAGDVLQTLAFKTIADDETLPSETRIKLISIIAKAAGTPHGMVAGQQLDLDAEGRKLNIDEIDRIHRGKTGAIITASALAGAIIADATDDEQAAIETYASKLGLLFQITDDLLDVTQQSERLGKTAGKDVSAKKATYPSHFGTERTVAMANNIRDEACQALLPLNHDTTLLQMLADLIVSRTK